MKRLTKKKKKRGKGSNVTGICTLGFDMQQPSMTAVHEMTYEQSTTGRDTEYYEAQDKNMPYDAKKKRKKGGEREAENSNNENKKENKMSTSFHSLQAKIVVNAYAVKNCHFISTALKK
jgi:hypothetical protein